jgi:hypothetical protein
MKTGGLGGMFFSIDHARFIYRQLLAAPRLARDVSAVAPQIEGKLLYLRTADRVERPVRADGEIPSRTAAVGASPSIAEGQWVDDDGDRRWRDPTPFELRNEIDHFHLPPAPRPGATPDESWAEWHYFNIVAADRRRWAFISFIVAGAVPNGRWGGQVLVTLHEQGKRARRFVAAAPGSAVRFSTTSADLAIGDSRVTVLPDGRYRVQASTVEEVTPPDRQFRVSTGTRTAGGEFRENSSNSKRETPNSCSLAVADDDRQHVLLAQDQELIALVLELGAGVLGEEDPIALLDVQRHPVAIVEHAARTDGQYRALLGLLACRVRQHDAAARRLLLGLGLDDHPITQRLERCRHTKPVVSLRNRKALRPRGCLPAR